ncbi:MAG: amylo-alpha-1,6-glucosidase [Deltaproteobacteria bacterium]|nr:amylo-alpha-1,6-glucosidase [Deltaproteobacteria bacterium]
MTDIIEVMGKHYILATSALADEEDRILKQDDTFAVFNRWGDIEPIGLCEEGIFHQGTRFLSKLGLRIGENERPMLLGSGTKANNAVLLVDLTNSDQEFDQATFIPRGSLHMQRQKIIWQGAMYEKLSISNFHNERAKFTLSLAWDADFADIFEVRGHRRKKRGARLQNMIGNRSAILSYKGLDNVVRRTRIDLFPQPLRLDDEMAYFEINLEPGQRDEILITVTCTLDEQKRYTPGFAEALHQRESSLDLRQGGWSELVSSNAQFDSWLNRSRADLLMLTTNTEHGPYPFAGIPWYCTPFGRDGLITAFQTLWVAPDITRGVLSFLAATQASETDDENDAAPGKILHEARTGELADLREIPFKRYYGSVDSTPLFVVLAGAYYDRTADSGFVREIWPHILRALEWIEVSGDADKDGFIEYQCTSSQGLSNQGWKDSSDSIFHADGSMACGAIALGEVQGYVYQAYLAAAKLACVQGEIDLQRQYSNRADRLKRSFDDAFWIPEMGCYAIALDGEKAQCKVRTSNMGHALFSGIADQQRAEAVAANLLTRSFFSGWGIRTLASGEPRYNPISYHNGSIWPHDNSMIALGFARYGFKQAANLLLASFFDVAQFSLGFRLPELFCGVERQPGVGPTHYPVACQPQAWASGAVFLMLQACLGLKIDAPNRTVEFDNPTLPSVLDHIEIYNLKVSDGTVDLFVHRHMQDAAVNVREKRGELDIVVKKSKTVSLTELPVRFL